MDALDRRIMGMIQSHLQTMYKQTDLRVEAVAGSEQTTIVRVWDALAKDPRTYAVIVSMLP